jgi:nitrite reductase (NADH) small subunit
LQGQTYNEDEMHFVCPWHGYEYKLETGECASDARIRLQRFTVVERDGQVYVAV